MPPMNYESKTQQHHEVDDVKTPIHRPYIGQSHASQATKNEPECITKYAEANSIAEKIALSA